MSLGFAGKKAGRWPARRFVSEGRALSRPIPRTAWRFSTVGTVGGQNKPTAWRL